MTSELVSSRVLSPETADFGSTVHTSLLSCVGINGCRTGFPTTTAFAYRADGFDSRGRFTPFFQLFGLLHILAFQA